MGALFFRRRLLGLGTDPDAAAYLNAAGMVANSVYYPGTAQEITSAKLLAAVSTYFRGLKYYGLWPKFRGIWLYLLGPADAHKVNARTPGTFDEVYVGPVVHSSNGIKGNDTSAYVRTGLILSTHVGPASGGYALHSYTNTNNIGGQADSVDMGVYGSAANALNLATNNANTGSKAFGRAAGVQAIAAAASSSPGYYSTVQTGAGLAILYRNGQELARATGTATTPNAVECYILAMNLNGSPYGYTSRPVQFSGVSSELTAAEQANHYTLLLALQTTLKRA